MGTQRGRGVSMASPHGCPAWDNGPFMPALRDRDTLAACSGGGKAPPRGPSPTRGHGQEGLWLSPTIRVWRSVGLSQGDSVKYPQKLLYCLHPPYSQNSHSPSPSHHPLSHSPEPSHSPRYPILLPRTITSPCSPILDPRIPPGGCPPSGIPSQSLQQRIRVPWPYSVLGVSHNQVLSETPGASGNARASSLKG